MPLTWVRENFTEMKSDLYFGGSFKIFPKRKELGEGSPGKKNAQGVHALSPKTKRKKRSVASAIYGGGLAGQVILSIVGRFLLRDSQ